MRQSNRRQKPTPSPPPFLQLLFVRCRGLAAVRTKGTQLSFLLLFTCEALGYPTRKLRRAGARLWFKLFEASANLLDKPSSFARNNQVHHKRHREKGRRHEPCCFVLLGSCIRCRGISGPKGVTHEGFYGPRGFPLASCAYYGDEPLFLLGRVFLCFM